MPLDFRTVDEDRSFSMRRFLRTVGLGVGVFLAFLALGYYVIGPRLTFTPEGIPKLQWHTGRSEPTGNSPTQPPPPPKVEVYEKLPADVVAATGAELGSREVAPFDYERYLQRRSKVRSRKPPTEVETPVPQEMPAEDDTLVVPDEPEMPADEPPVDIAPPAPAEAPPPSSTPEPPQKESPRLYRVQVGVYDQRENANAVAQTVRASGFPVSIVPFQSEGRTRYRVQVLVTRDRSQAEQMKRQLESKGFPAYIAEVR
jgi:cell division protein FtsN